MAERNQKDYLKAYYQKNKKKLIIKAKKYREKNKHRETEMRKWFKKADKDKSKTVTFKEF